MSRRFGILALVGALILVTGDAGRRPGGESHGPNAPPPPPYMGDTGLWFVPSGRSAQGQGLVPERLPHQLGRRPGIHRHLPFRGHLRLRREEPRRNFRQPSASTRASIATRVPSSGSAAARSTAASTTAIPSCAKAGSAIKFGDTFLGAKVNLLSESRGTSRRTRHSRHGESCRPASADNEIGHREDGYGVRRHPQ